jgi:hypothetical protein
VEAGGVIIAPEIGADNGSGARNSPGFGFETELSGGASGRTGLRLRLAWKRRCGSGALTPEWRENVVTGEQKAVPSFRPRLDLDFEDRSSVLTRWRRKTSAASAGS